MPTTRQRATVLLLLLLGLASGEGSALAGLIPNDSFTSPVLLTGASGSREGDNGAATAEPEEPLHAGIAPGHSVWFLFHASAAGKLEIEIQQAGFHPVIAAYVGGSLGTLTPVADVRGSSLQFSLAAGVVYRIAVDTADPTAGTFTLRWRMTFNPGRGPDLIIARDQLTLTIVEQSFPANDCDVQEYCTLAGRRRLLRFNMTVENIGNEDLVFGDVSNSPMFHYAQCHNHYHFEAIAAFRVLNLSNEVVRVGNKHGFCLEDMIPNRPDAATNRVFSCDYQGIQAGWSDIYAPDLPCQYIDITGVPPGDYLLQIELDPQQQIPETNEENNLVRVPFRVEDPSLETPPNDDLANALELVGRRVTVLGNNSHATAQPGEPRHYKPANSLASRSLWYRWTAPASEPTVLSTEGSAFDTVLAVYTGTGFADFPAHTIVQGDDIDEDIHQSRVTFNATAGVTYFIAVDGLNGGAGAAGGVVVLNLNPALNDAFGSCAELAGPEGTTLGNVLELTSEPGEPSHAGQPGGNSAWFCWTAPTDGPFAFDTVETDYDTLLAIYTGSALDSLIPVASDDDSGGYGTSRVLFTAEAGKQYRIAVDRRNGYKSGSATGVYRLHWQPQPGVGSPVITAQPQSMATLVGSNALFQVSARGALPLTYQWMHGGVPLSDDARVSGAHTATLRVTGLRDTDRGLYSVVVGNPQGTTPSTEVNLVAASRHRLVYVDPFQATPERDILMRTFLVAESGEHLVQFSLMFDPTRLLAPVVEAGPSVLPSTLFEVDYSAAPSGRIGVRVTLPPGETWPPANHWIATLRARLASIVPAGARTPVCFDDLPLPRFVLDGAAIDLPTGYACGNVIALARDILTGHIRPDGRFELRLEGIGGATYDFQRSLDLLQWLSFSIQYNEAGVITLVDPDWSSTGTFFYRALRQ